MAVATKIAGQQSWDTDAEFRADCLAIHNALIASGGLIQTSDTGQTDFSANTRASPGYTVYRFNDADQSSYPLFIKIDWTPTATVRPGLAFTVGTGSNGSGTITGVISSSKTIAGGTSGGTGSAAADHYVSVGPGYLYVVLGIIAGTSGNQVSCMFSVERSTDEAGVTHPAEGIIVWATPANGKSYGVYPSGGAAIGPSSGSPLDQGSSSGFWDDVNGSDVCIVPVVCVIKGALRFHRMAMARSGRVSYGVSFDATHLGTTRKMISIELNYFHSNSSNGWTNVGTAWPVALLLPWN